MSNHPSFFLRKSFLRTIVLICFLSGASHSYAQVDYNKQYFNAKQLFREGKYNLAMEGFKPLIAYDSRNPFSAYASFYYALSAYNQGFLAVAKDMFTQIRSLHPNWDKLEEVNYWLGKLHLDSKDYFQGMKILSAVNDKKMHKDIEAMKFKSFSTITDLETLKRLRDAYPKDETIAKVLATGLAKDPANPANRTLLESLISQYNFKRTDFIPEAPKTFHKDVYTVSVMLPFMVNTLDPSPSRKRNQIVLDLYEGMKLAADTLDKQGIKISLRAYDTERNTEKIKKILATDELKSTDLIVGPFFQEENKLIQEFSQSNKINVFNPLSSNSDIIGINPYAFLYQPSNETLGRKTGEFLAAYPLKKKNCLVYYGTTKRDSVMAANFIQAATAKGLKIKSSQRIGKESLTKIMADLATPTEFDEFRYPKQFTLKKDSLGSIYVASDDALIYAKVLSGIETRGDSVVVLGTEGWLEQPVVDIEKFQTLPVILAAPNATLEGNRHYQAFFKKFISVHGKVPGFYAKIGYEFMLFAGHQLKDHGVYFQEGLNKQAFVPGYLVQGYNFQFTRDNQFVPFEHFKNGRVELVNLNTKR
jgi:tetratricopeptide (TPR) repeat protein